MISFSEAGQRMPTLKRLAATAHEEYATVHVEHGAISYESWCFRKAHNDYQTDIKKALPAIGPVEAISA